MMYPKKTKEKATLSVWKFVQTLPPTSAAAQYHSPHIYYQVQQWKIESTLHADDWGWTVKNGKCEPNKTDLPCAPKELLEVIRCNY